MLGWGSTMSCLRKLEGDGTVAVVLDPLDKCKGLAGKEGPRMY